jgi:hypothetical protein
MPIAVDIDPRLVEFIKRSFIRGQVTRVDVKHRTSSGASLVDSVNVEIGENIEDIARQAWELAQADADGHARPQRYWFQTVGAQGPMARVGLLFSPASGEEDDNGEIGETEEATPSGMAGMAMRHAEEFARVMVEGVSTSFRTLRLENEQKAKDLIEARKENAALRAERVETFEAYRTLVVALEDKSLEREKDRRQAEMEQRIMGKVELLFPVAMNKFLGRQGTDLSGEILEKVALLKRSIETAPARWPLIMAPLLPEQVIALQALISGDGVGPMTGELIRQFFDKLELSQVQKWAETGALTEPEIKLVAWINNACADLRKKRAESVEKLLPPKIEVGGVSANVNAALSGNSSEGK